MSLPVPGPFGEALLKAGGRLRVLSAVNPGLWLSLLTVTGYTTAVAADRAPAWPLAVAMLAAVAATVYAFVYFSWADPDRLHSEAYQLSKRAMIMVEDKGTKKQIADTAANVLSQLKIFTPDEDS